MKTRWKSLLIAFAIPLAVGAASALVTKSAMEKFAQLNQPPLSPPMWAFPIVWTILFAMMGFASYLIYSAPGKPGEKRAALWIYGIQLAVNFIWPILFFNLQAWLFAFCWLLLLWVMILAMTIRFYRIRAAAGWLIFPYLAWVTFAGYLNFGIYLLN